MNESNNESAYPMRLNKYLALKNYASRRGADELIAQQKVLLNGRVAVLGDKVNKDDVVEVIGRDKPTYAYFIYHKRANEIVKDSFTVQKKKVMPAAQLEKEAHGLIILTNDGRVQQKLQKIKKKGVAEYEITLKQHYSPSLLKILSQGVKTGGVEALAVDVKPLDENSFIASTYEIIPPFRSMLSALDFNVSDIKRTKILNLPLGGLKEATTEEITGERLQRFIAELGLA